MIKGAITQEKLDLMNENDELKNKSHIIFYCTIGYRSGLAAQKFGSSNEISAKCFNLKGSILLYLHSGGEIIDSQQKTTKSVNVYGKTWDLAPIEYTATYVK